MRPKHPEQDRPFGDLQNRFKRNIYQTMKGRLRLAVLRRDFAQHIPTRPLRVLDVGAGLGYWAKEMLAAGHEVWLTDVSPEILAAAKEHLRHSDLTDAQKNRAHFCHQGLQTLSAQLTGTFDVINCHAVMEWLEEPHKAFDYLIPWLAPQGWCSIIFYNQQGLIFKNLLRAHYQKIQRADYRGQKGSLTPLHPLLPEQVLTWAKAAQLNLICHSGIRVFHDYILNRQDASKSPDTVEQLELQFSQQSPYRELGRYQHLLLQAR